ncbi:RNHCP domain-containing protein [Candidatus Gracilibacteria bacterium]|nr:RNHCP domain-containing protein [Candidatus Gracilibacteria bacterium]
MSFIMRNETFTCEHCGAGVTLHPTGSARNHCPACLYSKHVDDTSPGDRLATCHGLMAPIGIDYKKNKGDMIRHKCTKCQKEMLNIVAPDDNFIGFVRRLNQKIV